SGRASAGVGKGKSSEESRVRRPARPAIGLRQSRHLLLCGPSLWLSALIIRLSREFGGGQVSRLPQTGFSCWVLRVPGVRGGGQPVPVSLWGLRISACDPSRALGIFTAIRPAFGHDLLMPEELSRTAAWCSRGTSRPFL